MSQYWINRNKELERIKAQFNSDADYNRELARIYNRAQREIDKEIQSELMSFASREQVSMAEARRRVDKMDVEAFKEKAKRYVEEKNFSPRANEELRSYNVRMRMSRLELLKHDIHLETVALADEENKLLTARLSDEARAEFERQAGILGEALPDNLDRIVKQIVVADFQGTDFSERIWRDQKQLRNALGNTLDDVLIRGQHPRKASKQLRELVSESFHGKRGNGGAKYVAERLAITESARIQSGIQKASYEEYDIQQYEYLAEPDACDICGAMDGEIFNVSAMQPGVNASPMHSNCRCSSSGVVDRQAFETELDKRLDALQETIAEPFVPASTIGQANSYARDTLGVEGANYKGLDIKVANEWNRGLKDSFDRFPKLKDKIKFTGEIHERNNAVRKVLRDKMIPETTKANPDASPKAIRDAVNRHINKVTRKLKPGTNTLATSWTPKNEPYNQFSGVTINRNKGANASRLERTLERQVEIKFHAKGTESIRSVLDHEIGHQLDDMLGIGKKKEVRELFDSRTKEELTNDLARYVWDNNNADKYSEMVAEAWSEYVNNPEPREIAKTIGSIIESEYNSIY